MGYVIHYAGGQIPLPEGREDRPVTGDLLRRIYDEAVKGNGWFEVETSDARSGQPRDGGVVRLRVGDGIPFGLEWRP